MKKKIVSALMVAAMVVQHSQDAEAIRVAHPHRVETRPARVLERFTC